MALLFLFGCTPSQAKTENEWVAATLILEAGGESDPRAMTAVYEVLRNRAKRSGRTLYQEAFRPKQFSCWNAVENANALFTKASKHRKFSTALKIVEEAKPTNFTLGATHYHATYVSPYWAPKMTKTTTIQNHIFYKE